jgi:hypothetical protein
MKPVAVVLAALAAFASVSPALAAEKDALGTWDVVATTAEQARAASVMTIAKVDGKLKAEVEFAGARRAVSEESLEGDVLKLKVMYEGILYTLQARIAKSAFEGTWEGPGNSGTLTAKKRP